MFFYWQRRKTKAELSENPLNAADGYRVFALWKHFRETQSQIQLRNHVWLISSGLW